MSTRTLTADEYTAAIRDFQHTAFRLEVQPEYPSDDADGTVKRWLDGDSTPPLGPAVEAWLRWVGEQVADGKRIERVRVFEDPPTDYQRWLHWASRWNVEAGEHQRYMTRRQAHEVGLLPAAGPDDWWLLDSRCLVTMRFNDDGSFESEMTTDPQRVVQACAWRDLAVHHSAPDTVRGHAALEHL